jgi:hypothetical protein
MASLNYDTLAGSESIFNQANRTAYRNQDRTMPDESMQSRYQLNFEITRFGHSIITRRILILNEAVSNPQIAPKGKARAGLNTEHTWEYVSISRRLATP